MIEFKPAHGGTEGTWAWLAVDGGLAVGVLTVDRTPADHDVAGYDEHATIKYVFSAAQEPGIGRKLLAHAKSELLRMNLTLYGSGVATCRGRRALASQDIEISPATKYKWANRERQIQKWDLLAPRNRTTPRPAEPQRDLDSKKAREDGERALKAVAAMLDIRSIIG
ncbi:hypothetical protein [Rhodococcus opacus]|uniref:hypothetical protein n=1 Tax=Rhodococcus opacus TaxID=37919 RepID=UPI0006BB45B9|nr:hypothetical protein [Rhodococcus opacus]